MQLQTIWRGVVGDVLTDISQSNIFLTMTFPSEFCQNDLAVLAAVSINELTHSCPESYLTSGICIYKT